MEPWKVRPRWGKLRVVFWKDGSCWLLEGRIRGRGTGEEVGPAVQASDKAVVGAEVKVEEWERVSGPGSRGRADGGSYQQFARGDPVKGGSLQGPHWGSVPGGPPGGCAGHAGGCPSQGQGSGSIGLPAPVITGLTLELSSLVAKCAAKARERPRQSLGFSVRRWQG